MVYCTKCGTLNPDNATNCSNCGAPLYGSTEKPYLNKNEYRQYQEGNLYNRRSSGFGLLIAGIVIILIGLAFFFDYSIGDFFAVLWPVIIVIIGAWLIFRGVRRNRRFKQSAPLQ